MTARDLQVVTEEVLRRAELQGHILAREIRQELSRAGHDPGDWKEVVGQVGAALERRRGRYHFQSPAAIKLQQDKNRQHTIQRAVRQLIRQARQAARKVERRTQDRLDYIQPATVITEDGRSFKLLSRDLSPTGIRLVGAQRLLGQKVQLILGPEGTPAAASFVVRILWTCAVGDDLFENGGMFLDVVDSE